MARINLLPWREERRNEKKREFGVAAAGSVLLMGGIVLLAHIQINGMIGYQESRNRYIQEEIKQVESKIREIRDIEKQKAQLIARMRVIERLQRNRPEVVHLFQELVERIPEGVQLSQLSQSGSAITLKGQTQSNARVSSFMRALDSSDWFTKPQLDVIQSSSRGGDRTRSFTLRIQQANPAGGSGNGEKG
ncbi:PilN domain-containing protein [Thiohalomonas denitrificans]|uniref:Type IV pilus assembly protein PilN n=1 Tax=Thiohalomonas denitrificans TaxID=415747 RepID=A0A1G5QXB2_9GAMM|nr:PilN domain-containing protein [Thiohalomonas denitrificans]SCZ66200.1 type IV pilus assembly protein PilN [Thiohalomonas denitrificans]